jgi:hypothetical protein
VSGRISYFGNVEPIIWLSFKTIKVPNAHQSANDEYLYAVENPELSEFTLHAVTLEGSYTVERHSTSSNRRYDDRLNVRVVHDFRDQLVALNTDRHVPVRTKDDTLQFGR